MKLRVERRFLTPKSTIGSLYIDDVFECYTLEDVVRKPGEKIKGLTAIPYGTYDVTIDHSNRFGKDMPHILNVPGFEGIRIHSGNTDADTEGCILLGVTRSMDSIGKSRQALAAFVPKLQSGLASGKVTIDVIPYII